MTRDGRTDRRGQALAEFALVLPVVLLLIFGLIDLGRAVFLANSVTNAAREGARFAIVHQDTDQIVERVESMVFTGEVTNAGDPDLVTYFRINPDGTLGEACTPISVGCIAVVDVKSQWTAITPLVGDVVGPITVEGRSELPIEFICPNPAIPAFDDTAECPKQP